MRCQDVRTYVRKALRTSGKAGFGCSDMRRCGLRAFGLRGLAFGRPRFGRFCRTKIGHGNFTPLFCDLMVHFHLPAVAESLNYGFSVHVVAQSLNYGFSLNYGIMAALVPYLMYQRPNARMPQREARNACSRADSFSQKVGSGSWLAVDSGREGGRVACLCRFLLLLAPCVVVLRLRFFGPLLLLSS